MGLGGYLVVYTTFALALLMMALRLPIGAPEYLVWARPDWVALVLLYWVLALPHRFGLMTGWILGLLVDSITGSILGQHALLLTLISWLGLTLYERLRMYSLLQQALVVFGILSFSSLLGAAVEYLVRGAAFTPLILLSALVSGLLWPWMFLALRLLRRRLQIA